MSKRGIIDVVLFLLLMAILTFSVSARPLAPYITIIDNQGYTNDITPLIQLADSSSGNNIPYEISFSCNNTNYVNWIPWSTTITNFDITDTLSGCNSSDGVRTIYVIGRNASGAQSNNFHFDNTTLDRIIPSLTDQKMFPDVVFNTTETQFNATITDETLLEQVLLSIRYSGTWHNLSVNTSVSDEFYYNIPPSLFNDEETIYWRYYGIDAATNMNEGSIQSFTLTTRTQCVLDPAEPNGNENWYTIIPLITCTADTARTPYCWFNGLDTFDCTIPFYYNISTGTAGIERFNYFSNDTNNNIEPEQSILIKVDVTSPKISDLLPANGSSINTNLPLISAYIDDIYQGNSGINLSSVKMYIDNVLVNSTDYVADTIDAILTYTPETPLSEGYHNVTVKAKDIANNPESEITWGFNVNTLDYLDLNLISPENTYYDTRRIPVEVNLNKEAYLEKSINGKKYSKLCTSCDYYDRKYSFKEGWNNITVKATDDLNIAVAQAIFLVDTKKPRIRKIEPEDEDYVNGTRFSITYDEDHLNEIVLYYKEVGTDNYTKDVWTHCSSGRNQECSKEINLSEFNGKQVEFYFEVKDFVYSINSSKYIVNVDKDKPEFTSIISPKNGLTYENRRVYLTLDVSEDAYLEASINGKRPRRLCKECSSYKKQLSFSEGYNTLAIKAIDKAGNSGTTFIEFYVDTRKPHIKKIEPKDNSYVNGTLFKIKYSEENLKNIILNYKENGATTEMLVEGTSETYTLSGKDYEVSLEYVDTGAVFIINNESTGLLFEGELFILSDGTEFELINIVQDAEGDDLAYFDLAYFRLGSIKTETWTHCTSGSNQECSKTIDLSSYDNKQIEFYFTVNDEINSVDSKTNTLNVDRTKPSIDINIIPDENKENIYYIEVQLDEKVALLEKSENDEPYKMMCRNCNYSKKRDYFKQGSYQITVRATDYAGNKAVEIEDFIVVPI